MMPERAFFSEKSGSSFYLTQDDRFMIKTVKNFREVKVLIKMLPSYYQHVCRYENTLSQNSMVSIASNQLVCQDTVHCDGQHMFCSEYRRFTDALT
ncbi:hypothetical protein HAX54_015720 [Datura stramonium]|uniref:1-phosphatidylinositol-4-phosphate 5-kinase n=1 Tax=Datura stramonium TaxID=4076 RepID=A0ABS8UIA2_DATST|nr:hypothetical protein [Datura stramonium]